MKIQWFAFILALLATAFSAGAQDCPRAEIKVEYSYHETFVRGSDGIVERDIPFILLASKDFSKFYCPDTERKDSLESTPEGRAVSAKIRRAAIAKYVQSKDLDAMDAVAYRSFLYIFRSRATGEMTVYDRSGALDYGVYTEPTDEISWQIADSTKTILGYECTMAEALFHGRRWTAWFTPEVALSEGPWKLTGLPGLILEACEADGQHSFTATGIEASSQPMRPIYPGRDYVRTDRISMLRDLRHYRDHSNSINSAATGINFGHDHRKSGAEAKIDFLETDYHRL
ncbi:MAG: GLPGLI family protein [Muribaculaceae bacterium]|nr:GLPGLI family protein [Muribaculaceae bacterium]